MSYERPRALVVDGGVAWGQSRPALAAVRGFAIGGYEPWIATSETLSLASASRHAAGVVRVPPCAAPNFKEEIDRVVGEIGAEVLMPASDGALAVLRPEVADLIDKETLNERARAAGFRVPATEVFDGSADLLQAANRLAYPVMIKPAVGKPVRRCDNAEGLRAWDGRDEPILVQPYLEGELRAITGVMWGGRLVAVSHQLDLRTWPAAGGASSAAVTMPPDLQLESHIQALLNDYAGVFEAQLLDGHLLDLNLRAYGSLPLSLEAGLNLVSIFADLERDIPLEDGPLPLRTRPDVFYRWLEGDIRNAITRVRRREIGLVSAISQLLPYRHAAHGGPESISDPAPMVARARYLTRAARGDIGPVPVSRLRRSLARI